MQEARGMKAKRSFGQNFLVDRHFQQRIIAAVAPAAGETVIEIGPGQGALTQWLIQADTRLIAIEADRDLIPPLEARFGAQSNFTLVHADALDADYCELIAPAPTARVVANLPYYISTPILQRLIDARKCISEMTVMLQREVVERISARPGGKDYGYLSVLVQFHCEVERLFDVPPGAFRPAPRVTSSVVRLRTRSTPAVVVSDEAFFLTLTQVIFSQRRKTILNNLRAGLDRLGLSGDDLPESSLGECGIDLQRRAETLAISEIAQLAGCIGKLNEPRGTRGTRGLLEER